MTLCQALVAVAEGRSIPDASAAEVSQAKLSVESA
jgi:hypothetical protein